jgi:hypothetical protein
MLSKRPLYAWLPRRIDPFHAATPTTLVQLNDFGLLVKRRNFHDVVETIMSGQTTEVTSIRLVANIAAVLRKRRNHSRSDLLEKSIQETLLSSGDCDIDPAKFGRNVQAFVRESGCKGMIQLFMQLYLANVMMRQIHDSWRTPADLETLESLPIAIDRLSRLVVNSTTATWQKWPEFDESGAREILRSVRSRMTDTLAELSNLLAKSA